MIAVTRPKKVAEATVEINGAASYSYGYASSLTNVLTATVTVSSDDSDAASETYVKEYQWYKDAVIPENKIEGAVSSTYLIPQGLTVGTYNYLCEVILSRKDNGRDKLQSEPYEVKVEKSDIVPTVSNYVSTYDGAAHSFSLTVKQTSAQNDFVIYYGTTPLTSENYNTAGSTEQPSFTDVATDAEGKATAHTIYYYIKNTEGNYNDYADSATVQINPITLSVKAGAPFSKVYDGKEEVSGDVKTAGNDKYRLSHGTSSAKHYEITGLRSEDAAQNYALDFDATFNSKNVDYASTVTLTNMKVVNESGVVNANYAFTPGAQLVISGQITPLVLGTSWDATTSFVYDGTEHKPQVSLNDNVNDLPSTTIELTVIGQQTNVGEYKAYAQVVAKGGYRTSDYTFTTESCDFSITKRPVTITPDAAEKTYNGAAQRLTTFTISETKLGEGLVSGHTHTEGTDKGGQDVATYDVKAANMKIFSPGATGSASKIDVTDNYDITYGTAQLTIKPWEITVSGITAANKTYDQTNAASLNLSNVVFTPTIAVDRPADIQYLTLDSSKVHGTFVDANAGTNKEVTITIDEGALSGTSGTKASNYKLLVGASTSTQKTAEATIDQATLSAPTPAWSATTPGTVSWSPVSEVCGVAVSGYQVDLYRAGTEKVSSTTEESSTTSLDLASVIRTKGAGSYTVKVKAIADTNGNTDPVNVADSTFETTASTLYAAEVEVAFATDAITAAGKSDEAGAIKINNGTTSYVMLAGESNIPMNAVIKNTTGYTIADCTASNAALTITDGSLSGVNYSSKLSLGTGLSSSNKITVTLSLDAKAATLTTGMTADKTGVIYGYSTENAPKLTVSAQAATTDTITTNDYTYSYKWYLKEGTGEPVEQTEVTGTEWTFPTGKDAGTNYYTVYCDVTAT